METDPAEKKLLEDWKDKLFRQWAQIREAHEAMMLDKFQKQNTLVRSQVRSMLKESGVEVPPLESSEEGDDMGVRVGDDTKVIHNHYPAGTKPATTSSPEKLSLLKRAVPVILGSVITAGALLGTNEFLKDEPSTPVSDSVDTDPISDSVDANDQTVFRLRK